MATKKVKKVKRKSYLEVLLDNKNFLVVIALLLILPFGISLWSKNEKTLDVSEKEAINNNSTYSNNEYKFSLQYPKTYNIDFSSKQGAIISVLSSGNSPELKTQFSVKVLKGSNQATIDKLINEDKKNAIKNSETGVEDTKVGGISGKRFFTSECINTNTACTKISRYYILVDNFVYVISTSTINNEKAVSEIISSFKFTPLI